MAGVLLFSVALTTLLAILWAISSVARYFIKFLIFGVVSVLCTCIPIPFIMLLQSRDASTIKRQRNSNFVAAIARYCTKFVGITFSVEGHENIVKDKGCVVILNHQSCLDTIVLACLWPIMPNSVVIVKKEVFYMQPFGLAIWYWGTIFIDRANKEVAKQQLNETAEVINKRKARVLMFPEGTRNNTKKLLPFKKGAFHLAIASQCPIQPVAVSRYTFLGNLRFDDGHIKIKILPPISTKGKTVDDLEKIMDESYAALSENVDLLSSTEERNANNKLKAK